MKNQTDFLSQVHNRLADAIDEEATLRREISDLVELRDKLRRQDGIRKTADEILRSETPNSRLLLRSALSMLKLLLNETAALREMRGLHSERMLEITELQKQVKPYLNEDELIHFIIEQTYD